MVLQPDNRVRDIPALVSHKNTKLLSCGMQRDLGQIPSGSLVLPDSPPTLLFLAHSAPFTNLALSGYTHFHTDATYLPSLTIQVF